MIKGRGLLAKALVSIDSDDILFYANGISNSVIDIIAENNFEECEIKKIAGNIGSAKFVYFSTFQVNVLENYNRAYVRHKFKMESMVQLLFNNYLIVRTSNLVGNNKWNKNTLFNYLYNSLKEGNEIHLMNGTMRNILDVEHFINLLDCQINQITNSADIVEIYNPVSFSITEIITAFEQYFKKSFNKSYSNMNVAQFHEPKEVSFSLVNNCKINLDNYLYFLLQRYYEPIVV